MTANKVRTSAKAIIINQGKILCCLNDDQSGDWYILPGGGQNPGETLHEALQRECMEEAAIQVDIGPLLYIREYIGKNHEFAREDENFHQVEFMFLCQIKDGYKPDLGTAPDLPQKGVVWLPLKDIAEYRLYPGKLKEVLPNMVGAEISERIPVYWGDVN